MEEKLPNYQELSLDLRDEQLISDATEEFKKIISKLKPESSDSITPEDLDEIYRKLKRGTWWRRSKRNYVVIVLGIGLGNYFVSKLGFKWIVIKDSLGRDLAVKHFDSNLISFPISSVRKRIGTSELGFFKAIVEMFKHKIENKNVG